MSRKKLTPEQYERHLEYMRKWRKSQPKERVYIPAPWMHEHATMSLAEMCEFWQCSEKSMKQRRVRAGIHDYYKSSEVAPIARPAAVPTCRFGCEKCRYHWDCTGNLLMGGACLCEALLVGEVA